MVGRGLYLWCVRKIHTLPAGAPARLPTSAPPLAARVVPKVWRAFVRFCPLDGQSTCTDGVSSLSPPADMEAHTRSLWRKSPTCRRRCGAWQCKMAAERSEPRAGQRKAHQPDGGCCRRRPSWAHWTPLAVTPPLASARTPSGVYERVDTSHRVILSCAAALAARGGENSHGQLNQVGRGRRYQRARGHVERGRCLVDELVDENREYRRFTASNIIRNENSVVCSSGTSQRPGKRSARGRCGVHAHGHQASGMAGFLQKRAQDDPGGCHSGFGALWRSRPIPYRPSRCQFIAQAFYARGIGPDISW